MEPDFSALERLVTTWRQRAESLRGGSPETAPALARAEAYDATPVPPSWRRCLPMWGSWTHPFRIASRWNSSSSERRL